MRTEVMVGLKDESQSTRPLLEEIEKIDTTVKSVLADTEFDLGTLFYARDGLARRRDYSFKTKTEGDALEMVGRIVKSLSKEGYQGVGERADGLMLAGYVGYRFIINEQGEETWDR